MRLLYNAAIHGYTATIRIAALTGNKKAAKWIEGRKNIFKHLPTNNAQEKVAWFHCASLGEFEQGRPVIEAFREKYPDYKILLTFFSPSGYEVRKNYEKADHVFYLPVDTPKNARRFIKQIRPQVAFFVKYEFWFNYLNELWKWNIPTYLVSGIFRKKQHFFKAFGGWFRKQLKAFDKFFVQNEESFGLIEIIYPGKSVLTGDTRFDRVYEIAGNAKAFPDIKSFKEGKILFLAGSTWPADEEVFLPSVLDNLKQHDFKVLIAPHEVNEQRINALMNKLPDGAIRYSQASGDFSGKDILVIDSIGLLSHLYQYGDIAYIGGGFGVGIHNTLEAAAFGLPIIFGPNYQKFQEAAELIQAGGAVSIQSPEEFRNNFEQLLQSWNLRKKTGKVVKTYVINKKGGTKLILEHVSSRI